MGIKRKSSSLAGALFSDVQRRVLGLLVGQPDRPYQITEIIDLAGSGHGAVQRELEKLVEAAIVNLTVSGKRKLYQANRQSPIFAELHGIIVKTVGLIEPLRKALSPHRAKIEAAFVFGSVAKGADTAKSDIDLMIIGKGLSYGEAYATLQKADKILHRPVNPNLMTPAEWKKKLADGNAFVKKVSQQPKLFVLGTEHELNAA